MALVHGKNATFSYNSVALAADLKDVEQDSSRAMGETTSFNDAAFTGLPGKPKHSYKLGGFFDPASSKMDATIFADMTSDTARATSYVPGGGSPSATNPNYTGSAYATKYTIKTSVNAPAEASADLEVTGALTRASS